MAWLDTIYKRVKGDESSQIINDSKTPSGRVHVGSLRGPLIHDAVYKFFKEKGTPVRYLYGVDDFDPLDEIPIHHEEFYKEHVGKPLCNAPAPPGSRHEDLAKHFISEFFDIFEELAIKPEIYYLRDLYHSGKLDESIELFLNQAEKVREIDWNASRAKRSKDWHPFQAICEQCGKVGTTVVTDFDGKEVTYTCHNDLVSWAEGCGYQGKVSPFEGRGKLPWKFEWAAKWKILGVTIEGAGMDHCTKGGSRDVTTGCFQTLYRSPPPLNIPYEFFMVDGAKMSSSKGVGTSARAMADFLSPELLRFLMLRTRPNRPVEFSVDGMFIKRLFDEYDKYKDRYFSEKANDIERLTFELSQVQEEPKDYFVPSFALIVAIIQLPHVDIVAEIERRKGSALTELEKQHLERRIRSARHWLDHYATDEEKLVLQEKLPESASALSETQKAFLHQLIPALEAIEWEEDAIQSTLFSVARLTPLAQGDAFTALYRVFFDRSSGPKAGNILSFLNLAFVIERLKSTSFDLKQFHKESSTDPDAFELWLQDKADTVKEAGAKLVLPAQNELPANAPLYGFIELTLLQQDDKSSMKRIAFSLEQTETRNAVDCLKALSEQMQNFLQSISKALPCGLSY